MSVYFVLGLFAIALLAPFLAGNKPYFYSTAQETTYPILETLPFVGSYFVNPDIQNIDFRSHQIRVTGHYILPPIPYSPTEINLDEILLPPGPEHLMGTDAQGRDVMARMIHGSQVSLSVGFVAVGLYVIIGIVIGSLAGYFGGKVDVVLSRLIEVVMCFPTFFLILTILAFLGPSLWNIMIVIGVTSWTGIARLVRGEFLKLRHQDFVVSTKALGLPLHRILFRHLFPNSLSPVLVSITFGVASSILIESSLSFLGVGVQPPRASWGSILSDSRQFMDIAWWLMMFPGFAIFLTITSFNLIGEGLRDAVDPKSES